MRTIMRWFLRSRYCRYCRCVVWAPTDSQILNESPNSGCGWINAVGPQRNWRGKAVGWGWADKGCPLCGGTGLQQHTEAPDA